MTTVLPAWKLELIEKKKKKEQDHRQKVEQEKSRKVSIPEWKRSLLEKKKEAASDSPEHGVSVNSVFGPRIIRKTSQLNLPIVNSSQKPAVSGDYEENKTNILQDVNKVRGGSLSSSPADANSCVTKAVEIPTEVEHKSNKLSTRKEIENNRERSRQSDVAALREDSIAEQSETKLDNDHSAKSPSVLGYRRMFEQSKTESKETTEPCIIKNTQSKIQVQNDKWTTESTLRAVSSSSESNQSSQLQISNRSSVDKTHAIHSEKSTRSHPDSNQQKVFTPKPTFAPKPYKNFVTTPPWLKNTSAKNVTFQIGHNSVQEDVVPTVNTEVQSAPKDFDTSEKKSYVIEFGAKENITKTIETEDKQKFSFSNSSEPIVPSSEVLQNGESVKKTTEQTVLPPEKTVQKYSVIKETDSIEEQLASKSNEGGENLKYIVIDSRNQEEPTSTIEEDKTPVNTTSESVSRVPNESAQHEEGENILHSSSIESLRSKFGSIGGYRRWTNSEENIFLKGSQAEQSDQVVVIRRSSELKRPPPTKRWSADILSLTSKPIDNCETLNLSATSETKNLPSATNQVKRPPPPVKRWTADVINVMSQQTDDMSNLSPRSDSSNNSMISPSNSLSRGRSSSLCDSREETGLDYFQHKSNVAQGIEHRVNKLIRKMSISETQVNVDDEESDSTSDEDPFSDLDLKLVVSKEKDVPVPPQDVQPVFARKHSVSSEIEHRVTELFHLQLSQQSDADESEGEKSSESDANITVVQVVDDVKEPLPENQNIEMLTAVVNTKPANDFHSAPERDDHDAESSHILRESKPVSGSVHKLSALFGSSILKPKKKDKSVTEEKTKDKASKSSKLFSSDRSNQKGSSGDDGKKSTLFSKAQKSEGKSALNDKQQCNTSIFPWLRKNDKKERSGGNKTKELLDKNQKNTSSSSPNEGTNTVSIAAFGLQPVRKPVKVEQTLFGNVKIISNASHKQTPPKGVYHKTKASVQISEPEKEKIAPKKANESKTGNETIESQVPAIITQHWNGNEESHSSETSVNESVPVTSIDEVPVSAIDMPESGDSDVTVSVIDVPASPDNGSAGEFAYFNGHKEDTPTPDDDVSVSVIDLPLPGNEKISAFQDGYLEADELSDGSDEEEVEGSYNFATGEITHVVHGDITQDDEDDDDDDEDEDEDDDDEDVPISYIGSAPQYPVPQVVFDSEPVQLKSCLSPKVERKKVRFKP